MSNRRDFLKASLLGGIGLAYASQLKGFASLAGRETFGARVSLTTGGDRADQVFRALQPFAGQIRQDIGNKLVVLKPNVVSLDIQLAVTHVETLEGILEFLKSIGKGDNVVIAESAAAGPTLDGFSNFGYGRLVEKYPVKLVDLDQDRIDIVHVFDERDFRPHAVRMASLLLNPDSYVVSVARMKTHDRILATLSLKNIVVGAPIKDMGFAYGPSRKPGSVNDKPIVHGSGYRGINYNLYTLAHQLHPDLAVIDGYDGMEGNGPNNGNAVDHRICVVSTDWLAADRVGVELMGIDFSKVGYLNYCAQTGLGVADLNNIEILGEPIAKHVIPYKLHDNIERQLVWMNPVTS